MLLEAGCQYRMCPFLKPEEIFLLTSDKLYNNNIYTLPLKYLGMTNIMQQTQYT
jgi:hypothetical protein